jgi:sugar O-acyltransferase (sialic acid O-acetyltransferase NeuD family)
MMMMEKRSALLPVRIPLLNPNEPEALLASLLVEEDEPIQSGEPLAVIETTKSTAEVLAEQSGFVVGLRFAPGEMVSAGDVLGYIGESPDAMDPDLPPWSEGDASPGEEAAPGGLRITEPARALALEKGLDLDSLPKGPLVTRHMVAERTAGEERIYETLSRPVGEHVRLLIYGAGGHGRSLAALIREAGGFELAGFVDDGRRPGERVLGLPVLGGRKDLPALLARGICLAVNGVGGIGDLESRLGVFEALAEAGFICPEVQHPTAFVEDSAAIAPGAGIFPLAYIGTQAQVGFGCIVNTGAIVSHDCVLGAAVNLSPGATLAGGVVIGEGALIGMRATVNLGVRIGARAQVGNGATVKADVPEGGLVPAGAVWPLRRS